MLTQTDAKVAKSPNRVYRQSSTTPHDASSTGAERVVGGYKQQQAYLSGLSDILSGMLVLDASEVL